MIVEKVWHEVAHGNRYQRRGWYLFGFIPLFIRDENPRGSRRNGRWI